MANPVDLEPQAKAVVDANAAPPYLFELGPDQGRRTIDELQSGPVKKLIVDLEDTTVPGGPSGQVSVRIRIDAGSLHHWSLQRIRQHYRHAPHFDVEFPWMDALLRDMARQYTDISRIDAESTRTIAAKIGITDTRFLYASELDISSTEPTERLLAIVRAVGGTSYLSGPSAQAYMNLAPFEAAGIPVEWMTYNYPEYEQPHPPFTHEVSILDLILCVGAGNAGRFIRPTA